MPTPTCIKCKRPIATDDINVARDVAFCRSCDVSYKLSDLTHRDELDAYLDLNNPPVGAWYKTMGLEVTTGATHRSIGTAIGLLLFGLFWNGIVSVFVLIAIAGTFAQFDIRVPHWFPAPNMNGSPMGLGMLLFLWIFLTPFIVIGLGMFGAFLSCLGGRTEVVLRGASGTIFNGIGSLGYRRRFDASSVKDVRIEDRQWRDSDGDRRRQTSIILETMAGKCLKFGSMFTEERRKFVAAALRRHFNIGA